MLRIFTRDADHLAPAPTVGQADDPAPPVWFDLISPSHGESLAVEQRLGISMPTRDEMEEIELSARLYQEDGAEFMTMTALTHLDGDDPVKTPVTFILKGTTLVTIRYAQPKPFDAFTARVQRPNGIGVTSTAGESVMIGLIEALIDRMADTLERLANEIDLISREVFRNKAANATKKTRDLQGLIEQIGRKGDFLTMVRESLVSISRLVAYHSALETSTRKIAKESRSRIKLIQRDAASLGEHATFMSSKINFLLDATLGLINLEQNQIIKIFTVASVIFLPPTLVASIYGMNFDIMPELKWGLGYPWAIGMMILSSAVPFYYFKRRGWL
jgi:magnesium transporter